MPPDDCTLHATVHAAQAGDRTALEDLLQEMLGPLEAFVRVRAGGAIVERESVHDLVQSVCREALADLSQIEYRGDRAFRNWLFLLATRKILDRHKYHAQDKRDVRREQPLDTGVEDALHDALAGATPSRIASAREQLSRFEEAVGDLPPDQRDAVAYVKLLGLDYAEVSQRLGRSESAVRGLVARGLATVSDALRAPPEQP